MADNQDTQALLSDPRIQSLAAITQQQQAFNESVNSLVDILLMNGTVNGPAVEGGGGKLMDNYDPDDPEYQRELRRPAEIKEDLHQMTRRARVGEVLKTTDFKRELDEVMGNQINVPNSTLVALKQISSVLLPKAKGVSSPLIPVNDLQGVDYSGLPKTEKLARCKLASLYRLVDLLGWTHGIFNHITLRLSSDMEHFLVNPFGLLYSEMTASSLVKVDMQGNILESGTTNLGVNRAGYLLHSAIHSARPDIKCIIHIHTAPVVAVSVMKCGLLPLSQESLVIGDVSYHEYTGILTQDEQIDRIARDLGPVNKVVFLRNHGLAACGETIEEAFYHAHNAFVACNVQVHVAHLGEDNLTVASDEMRALAHQTAKQKEGKPKGRYQFGELEFSAYMRQMDNAGYRTGYTYPQSLGELQAKKEVRKASVEVPPAATGYFFDDEYQARYGSPLRTAQQYKRHEWIYHTPNTYLKVDTGDGEQKWMPDSNPSSPNRGGVVTPRSEQNFNQFAPLGDNPREFKETQKKIRKEYYEDKIHAGPQSKILEGRTWEEAEEARMQQAYGQPDQVVVVGAASKGIIKRGADTEEQQSYKPQVHSNPFANIDAREVDEYERMIAEGKGGQGETLPTSDQHEPGPFVVQSATVVSTTIDDTPQQAVMEASFKSDTLRSTDSGTDEETPTKSGKKGKFRMPSFSRGKKKKDKK